jgi:uncharacterized membrane protein YhhN
MVTVDAAETISGVRKYAWYPFLIVSFLHLVFIAVGNDTLTNGSKQLLMPALLIALLLAAPKLRSATLVLAALGIVFSWFGDVLLQSPAELGFLIGLAAFLVAHLFYISTFITVGSGRLSAWTALYLVWYVALLILLVPQLGALTTPVVVYGAVLGSAAVLATRVNMITGWGAALFLVSDSVLAIDRFAPQLSIPFVDFLIMATYLAGEGLIVLGIIQALRARRG